MKSFGQLKTVELRDVWRNEATEFTPWLSENMEALGEALGMDLELIQREADVGDFSLDLLAKDLGSNRKVVIENQLTTTDHDHLGKLLTYAGGFDSEVVVWVANSIRDEHRQALDWLNQKTGEDVAFFGVVVEVLKIDDSKPAFRFKPVVSPNEWQKSKRSSASGMVSPRGKAYAHYFQKLAKELKAKGLIKSNRKGLPQNWLSYSTGHRGVDYSTSFAQGNRVRTEIYFDLGEQEATKALFDELQSQREEIEKDYGTKLEWERLDEKRASRVAIYRSGSIEDDPEVVDSHMEWQVQQVANFKRVFPPRIKKYERKSKG